MIQKSQILPIHKLSQRFHAHVYFDDGQLDQALSCYGAIQSTFADLELGRVHTKSVGPHLKRQFQIALDQDTLTDFVLWLDEQRGGLSVLVHPLTADEVEDHTRNALWLGDELPLKLAVLEKSN